MRGKLTILGCGGSGGVPLILNEWGVCDPLEPRNRRTRCSAAVTTDTTTVIIDTGPDIHTQFNRENLKIPDGIIYTHEHSDHIAGIDELRTLQRLSKRKFDVYGDTDSMAEIMRRVPYMFEDRENGFYPAVCIPHTVAYGREYVIGDIRFSTYRMDHTTLTALGLRFGTVGYSVDFKRLDAAAIDALKGVDVWIADCAGYKSDTNPVHANLEEIYRINDTIKARQVYLTDMPPTMDYQTLLAELPKGYAPAYDGLSIDITF